LFKSHDLTKVYIDIKNLDVSLFVKMECEKEIHFKNYCVNSK